MAILRDVKATWKPAFTPDMIAQKLEWHINGKLIKTVYVYPHINSRRWSKDLPNFKLTEGDTIKLIITSVDEDGESVGVEKTVVFTVEPPEPPKNLELKTVAHYKPIPIDGIVH